MSIRLFSYPNHFLLDELCFILLFDSHRDIPHRAIEDNNLPPSKWGKDQTEADAEDFYPKEDLPKARAPRRGKASAASYYRNPGDTDTSDDECEMLVTLDVQPLNAFRPDPEAPSASGMTTARSEAPPAEDSQASGRGRGRGRGRSYKRTVTKGQEGAPPPKRQKVPSAKPKPKRPSFTG